MSIASCPVCENAWQSPLRHQFTDSFVTLCDYVLYMCAHLHCVYTFLCGRLMFYSHLLHNWLSEWIFSTLMEAVGPGGSSVKQEAVMAWQRPEQTDRLSGSTPDLLSCSACFHFLSRWVSCAETAADSLNLKSPTFCSYDETLCLHFYTLSKELACLFPSGMESYGCSALWSSPHSTGCISEAFGFKGEAIVQVPASD